MGFSLGAALGMDPGCGFTQTAPVCQGSVLGSPWKLFRIPTEALVSQAHSDVAHELMLQWGIRPSNSRCFSFCTSLESLDFLSSSHKTALTEGRRQYQHPLSQFSIWNLFRDSFSFSFSFCLFSFKGLYLPSFHLPLFTLVPGTLG